MELKLKFNDKERHFLYRVLAVVLCIFMIPVLVGFNMYLWKEWNFDSNLWQLFTAIIYWLIVIPIWRHYR